MRVQFACCQNTHFAAFWRGFTDSLYKGWGNNSRLSADGSQGLCFAQRWSCSPVWQLLSALAQLLDKLFIYYKCLAKTPAFHWKSKAAGLIQGRTAESWLGKAVCKVNTKLFET